MPRIHRARERIEVLWMVWLSVRTKRIKLGRDWLLTLYHLWNNTLRMLQSGLAIHESCTRSSIQITLRCNQTSVLIWDRIAALIMTIYNCSNKCSSHCSHASVACLYLRTSLSLCSLKCISLQDNKYSCSEFVFKSQKKNWHLQKIFWNKRVYSGSFSK